MDSENSQADENDLEPKLKPNEINVSCEERQSAVTQTCDHHPLSFMAMDYYKKYGENRNFPQYFILNSADNDINCSQHSIENTSVSEPILVEENQLLQSQDRKNSMRPPLIGQDNVNSEVNEDVLECVQPTSPTSSIASNKRLEWDSGADVGYSNYFNNKCRDRANSLPQLSLVERLILTKRMLRLEPEGITNDNQQYPLIITSQVLSKQDKSENELKNNFKLLSKCDETEKNIKLCLGTPNAESTPLLQNAESLVQKGYEITPTVNNPSKNRNHKSIKKSSKDACQVTECNSSDSDISNSPSKKQLEKFTDISEKSNEGYHCSLNLSRKSSNSCEDISSSPNISFDKIRKYRSYSNLDYEIITSKSSKQADRMKKGKKIIPEKSEKQIQTTGYDKLMVSKSVQVSNGFENKSKNDNTESENVRNRDNYKIHSSSEDPLEGSSKMHQNLSNHQNMIGTLNLPKSNSFEYLPGDTYEKISSDLQTESESMSLASKNRKDSYKSIEQLSDISLLHSVETHSKLYKAKYPLKNDMQDTDLQPSSSNLSQTSSGLISSGHNSINSTFKKVQNSRFSNSLVVDLEKTIDLLKKLIESKKCSISDKKKLIKAVVKKLVEANYEEDSDFSSHQVNKNKQSATFSKISNEKKMKNEERRKFQSVDHNEKKDNFDNSENTEDDILIHIYDCLGIEEDENGIIRKKKKHTAISDIDQMEKKDDFSINQNAAQTSKLEKDRKYEKIPDKSHTCHCKYKNKFNSQSNYVLKEKLKPNIHTSSKIYSKNYQSKENLQKTAFSHQSQSDKQIKKEAFEKNQQCENCLHKISSEPVDSHNKYKVGKEIKTLDGNSNVKRDCCINHCNQNKNSVNKVICKDQSTTCTSNFESNSYDSTYNTSSSKTDWRDNKTISEKLYEERVKCKHDFCLSQNHLLKKNSNKHIKVHLKNRCFINEAETVKQKIATKHNHDNKLLKFVNAERENQLSWINAEIKHLNNLRFLLEKRTVANSVDKTIVSAESKNKPSAVSIKTFITDTEHKRLNSLSQEEYNSQLEDNPLKHNRLDEIDNSNDQSDLEWSSHKNMKISAKPQVNLENKCQHSDINYRSYLSTHQIQDISKENLNKLTSYVLNKNLPQCTKDIQTVENMHVNTVINKDLVFASGDAKPKECHNSYEIINGIDLHSKHFSSENKKSDTGTDSKCSNLYNKEVCAAPTINTQLGVQSNMLKEDLTIPKDASQSQFSQTCINETDYVQNKIEVDINHTKNEQFCKLEDPKLPECISVPNPSKKENREMKTDKPNCVHPNIVKTNQVINEKYQEQIVSTYNKEYRESFTQTPSISNSRHSSYSGKELKLISDIGKHKTINAFTQTEKYEGNNVARNCAEKITKKLYSESTDISSDVFTCSNQSDKSNQRIQETNKDYNPSVIECNSNISGATLSNSTKCEFCVQIATRKKVIESIKNCKCCQSSDNLHSVGSKSYELCSRCDKIIQNKIIQNQRCLNCFHKVSKKSSSKETLETLTREFKKDSAQTKEPIAYFLKVESKEDLRNTDEEQLQHKNVPLEEVKVFVPKKKPQKNTFSNFNFQFNQINNILMNRYDLEKENNPSVSSQSNLNLNTVGKSTLSLQEYLIKNRPDFVDIAEARRKCLLDLALLRQFRKEKQKMLWSLTGGFDNVNSDRPQNTRRIFTTKMMKDITKKRYKKLPEIKKRAYEQKIKQEALTNRLTAQIFNKKLQEKVHKGQITLSHTVNVISPL